MEHLLKKTQKILDGYCVNYCKAQCCRRGKLLVKTDELEHISKDKKLFKKKDNTYYELNLDLTCPALKDSRCSIHKNSKRPKVCGQYPLFIEKDHVLVSKDCLAIKEEMLDEILKEFEENNYRVVKF